MENLRGSAAVNKSETQGAGLILGREQFENTSDELTENRSTSAVDRPRPVCEHQRDYTKSSQGTGMQTHAQ